ncbi:MAG: TonB C-terminal domain-containing protein [Pseudomonadota bacterium]
MKTQIIAFAAGALLAVVPLAAAQASADADRWLAESQAALQARITQAGLNDDGRVVVIRIKASESFRDYGAQVAESSGSADFDNAVKTALKGVRLSTPPIDLSGRRVSFTLGETPPVVASAR